MPGSPTRDDPGLVATRCRRPCAVADADLASAVFNDLSRDIDGSMVTTASSPRVVAPALDVGKVIATAGRPARSGTSRTSVTGGPVPIPIRSLP